MAGHRSHYFVPSQLDAGDPRFSDQRLLSTNQAQCDSEELITGTKKMLAESRALLKETDRILAVR